MDLGGWKARMKCHPLFPSTTSNILVKMVNNLNPKRIPRQRLTTVNEVVHSELFQRPECRRVLLPTFISQIRQLLAAGEEVSLPGSVIWPYIFLFLFFLQGGMRICQ